MAIKEILIIVDNGRGAEERMQFAAAFAQRVGARLTGLYARPFPAPYTVSFPEGGVYGEIIGEMERLDAAQETKAHVTFVSIAKEYGIEVNWRSELGQPAAIVATSSRYTDLVIIPQRDPEGLQTPYWMPAPENVIVHSARGCLILPLSQISKSDPKHILLAWNASREASRAVDESRPLLEAADKVTVAVVNAQPSVSGHGAEPGTDIARYLARLGVNVDLQLLWSGEADPAKSLLRCAFDIGADLIVAGCNGRSRLTEILASGTTRELLQTMNLPVFMAH